MLLMPGKLKEYRERKDNPSRLETLPSASDLRLLTESEKSYKACFETASDVIFFSKRPNGLIVRGNPSAGKMLGYSEKEYIGKSCRYGVPTRYDDFQRSWNLAKKGIIITMSFGKKNKSSIYPHGYIYVDGQSWHNGNIRDHWTQKTWAQLIQAQKMEAVGLLAGGIAHELHNIMSAIVGYGYLLKRIWTATILREHVDQILYRQIGLLRLLIAFLPSAGNSILNPKPIAIMPWWRGSKSCFPD